MGFNSVFKRLTPPHPLSTQVPGLCYCGTIQLQAGALLRSEEEHLLRVFHREEEGGGTVFLG